MKRWFKRTFGRWHLHNFHDGERFRMLMHRHVFLFDHWHSFLDWPK